MRRIYNQIKVNWILNSIGLITISVILLLLVWSANKGFDLSDEGYYITGYSNLIEKKISIHGFQFFTQNTFSKFGSGLIYFRILRLVLTLLSCIVLSIAVIKWLSKFIFFEKNKNYSFCITMFCIIGSLSSYGFGPQTLSYNHYTLIFGNIFLALLLFSFTNPTNNKKQLLLSALAGLIIGFEFFIKSPTAILFFLLYIISQLYLIREIKKKIFLYISVTTIVVVFSFLFICYPISPIAFFNEYIFELIIVSKAYGHDIKSTLLHYVDGIKDIWEYHLSNYKYTFLILTLCLALVFQKKYKWLFNIANIVFIGVFLSFMYILYQKEYFQSGVKHVSTATLVYIVLLYLTAISFLITLIIQKKITASLLLSKKYFVLILLILFPIICSLGTNNFLHVQIIFHLNTWYLFAFISFLYIKSTTEKYNSIILLILVTFVLKSCLDVYSAIIIEPYRINGSLYNQTEPLYIKHTNETIYIDKKLKNNLTVLGNFIDKQNPNSICNSSDFTGLAYIYNKKLPGYGIFDCSFNSTATFICNEFEKSKITTVGKTLFIQSSTSVKCESFFCFTTNKIGIKQFSFSWNDELKDTIHVFLRDNANFK